MKHTLVIGKTLKLRLILMAKHDAGSTSSDFIYDVFLSFRGDTRHSFTDHLYDALNRGGIHTFRDVEGLRMGEVIRPTLLDTIEKSRMSIVVLCENYASSTWCLDELVKIMECSDKGKKRRVLPIFYKVEPSDIRKQKNRYGEAMIDHEKRFGKDSEKVKAWKSALSDVCDISGKHCGDDTYEAELIKKIVKDTSAQLPPMPLQIEGPIIGLDSRIEEVISLIDIDSKEVRMLGIYGAGGIGKTEFARNLYNKIRDRFEAASFLHHVREKSNKSINGLEDLQKTLLSEMGEEIESMMIGSTFKGGSEIKRRLHYKRVLLVLDDVDSINQLESLAGGLDWFDSGSRIIITTRDTDVLDKHAIQIEKYKMEELNDHDSLELFCWHAFNMSGPTENFADVTSRAIKYAKGIPLALRVVGSNLKGGSTKEWKMELNKYKEVPDAEIQGVLEVSYNNLSELDQKIFLDIACFFKGERWEYVKRILEACDFYPKIRVFVSKCLITVDEDGLLEMHDLIQDMGREIVRKESPSNLGNRSRLWSYKEVLQILKENLECSRIEGIMLDPPQKEEVDCWNETAFEKMRNLRILIVRNTIFSTGPTYLPNSLRLLDWDGYPSKSFPPNFFPNRIVDFHLPRSHLILEKPFQTFEDLTFIALSNCESITQIPNVSGAKKLRVLNLERCLKLVGFDESIGFMPELAYLNASECIALTSFVPEMYLPSLEGLSFNSCVSLKQFPDVVQKMDKPLKIHMKDTAITEFPHSIGNLTGLEYIDMSFCRGLKDLSSSFLLLPKLVMLKIEGCSQLGESFKRFKASLSLEDGCSNVKTMHFRNSNLSDEDLQVLLEIFPKLEDLNVSQNDFVSLPECIQGAICLKSFDVSYCKNLKEIPELPLSVEKVDATLCPSLTSEASSVLWSKVSKEMKRIEVVMPETEIPEWFDHVCKEGIPHFWARRKFPVVALAFVFEEFNQIARSRVSHKLFSLDWQPVGLHLLIDGQKISPKGYHHFWLGQHHLLFCDLRVLFNDEEWKGLDASLRDDWNWKAVHVQIEADMILSEWGVYAYRQETNMEDIQFRLPNANLSASEEAVSKSPLLVPTPRHNSKRGVSNSEGTFYKDLFVEESGPWRDKTRALMMRMKAKAQTQTAWEASTSTSNNYGASFMQHTQASDSLMQELMKESKDIVLKLCKYTALSPEMIQFPIPPKGLSSMIQEEAVKTNTGNALEVVISRIWGEITKTNTAKVKLDMSMNTLLKGFYLNRDLKVGHDALRKRFEETQNEVDALRRSRTSQYQDYELLELGEFQRGRGQQGPGVAVLENLAAVWKERDEELQRLYDKNWMGTAYLDGLRDGLLEAQVSLLDPNIKRTMAEAAVLNEEEYAWSSFYGGSLELEVKEEHDLVLQELMMIKQAYSESQADDKTYQKLKAKHDSLRKKFQEFGNEIAVGKENSNTAKFPSSRRSYDELLEKFETLSAKLHSKRHQRNGLDREHDNTDPMVTTSNSFDLESTLRSTDIKCESLIAKLKERGEGLQVVLDGGIESLRNFLELLEYCMGVGYLDGLKDGLLEARVSFLALKLDMSNKRNDQQIHELALLLFFGLNLKKYLNTLRVLLLIVKIFQKLCFR